MASWQKVKINLPDGFDDIDKERIGERIITFIQERAIDNHKGFNPSTGRNYTFPEYTANYAKKKGVGKKDVDLILSSDMFNAMEVLDSSDKSITIGFSDGSDQLGKAEGNHKGTYGQPRANKKKARPFLGLTKKDLESILDDFR